MVLIEKIMKSEIVSVLEALAEVDTHKSTYWEAVVKAIINRGSTTIWQTQLQQNYITPLEIFNLK